MGAAAIPLISTLGPVLLILALAYPLRPQYGRLRTRSMSFSEIKTKLALQRSSGELPALPLVRSHRRS